MNKGNKLILLISIVMFLFNGAGCSSGSTTSEPKNNPETRILKEALNAGKLEEAVYKNAYLGLTINLSSNWRIKDGKAKKQDESAVTLISGSDKSKGIFLVEVYKDPIFKTGTDYINCLKAGGEMKGMDEYGDISTEKINGIDFSVLERRSKSEKDSVIEKNYAVNRRDCILCFSILSCGLEGSAPKEASLSDIGIIKLE